MLGVRYLRLSYLLILVVMVSIFILSCSKKTTEPNVSHDVVAAPVFTPQTGTYNIGQAITISCRTAGAIIRYTLDGSEPDSTSLEYAIPLVIPTVFINSADYCEIKAKAFKAGMQPSATVKEVFSHEFAFKVADPVITPDGGNFTHSIAVSITCPTENATIRYTTDGSEPTYYSKVYYPYWEDIMTNKHEFVVKTKAFKSTWQSSNTVSKTYTMPFYQVGAIEFPEVQSVAIQGHYAYISSSYYGIKIIDIGNPANPLEISEVQGLNHSYDIDVKGDYLYAAAWGEGLKIINVSNPAAPVITNTVDCTAQEVFIKDNYAYVADAYNGILILDISNPLNPVQVGTCPAQYSANCMAVYGNYLYFISYYDGLNIVDISDPHNPVSCGINSAYVGGLCIKVVGNRLYLGNNSSGLFVFDLSDPTNPALVGNVLQSHAIDFAINGSYVYATNSYQGLSIIDISDLSNPIELGYVYIGRYTPGEVVTDGTYAYVACSDGFQIIYPGGQDIRKGVK